MAVSWIKAAAGTYKSGTNTTISFTATNAGDLVIVALISGASTGTFNTPTATGTGWSTLSWTPLNPGTVIGTASEAASWWAFAPNTSATTITVAVSVTSAFICGFADEFTGMDTVAPIAGNNVATGSSANPSATVTPTADNCMLWGFLDDGATPSTPGAGFAKGGDDSIGDYSLHSTSPLTGGSGAAQTVNCTVGSNTWVLMMAAIQPPTIPTQLSDVDYLPPVGGGWDTTITVW